MSIFVKTFASMARAEHLSYGFPPCLTLNFNILVLLFVYLNNSNWTGLWPSSLAADQNFLIKVLPGSTQKNPL
jgi:hypothetical protein